jgi:hypothetical protein
MVSYQMLFTYNQLLQGLAASSVFRDVFSRCSVSLAAAHSATVVSRGSAAFDIQGYQKS